MFVIQNNPFIKSFFFFICFEVLVSKMLHYRSK